MRQTGLGLWRRGFLRAEGGKFETDEVTTTPNSFSLVRRLVVTSSVRFNAKGSRTEGNDPKKSG
jgi:hypothetical protein